MRMDFDSHLQLNEHKQPNGLSMSLSLAHYRLINANRTSADDFPEVPLGQMWCYEVLFAR